MAGLKRKTPAWAQSNDLALNAAFNISMGSVPTVSINHAIYGPSSKKACAPAKAKAVPKAKAPTKEQAPKAPKAPVQPRGRSLVKSESLRTKTENGVKINSEPEDLSRPLSRSPPPKPPKGFNSPQLKKLNNSDKALYALNFIRRKNTWVTQEALERVLRIPLTTQLLKMIDSHPSLIYSPKWGFKARTFSRITSKDELLAWFQHQSVFTKLDVRELKESWPEAELVIGDLVDIGYLLVLWSDELKEKPKRASANSKKNKEKPEEYMAYIYANDRDMDMNVFDQCRELWFSVPLPDERTVAEELAERGMTPKVKRKMPGVSMKKKTSGRKQRKMQFKENSHVVNVMMSKRELKKMQDLKEAEKRKAGPVRLQT